jgi:hypothetical protein
MTRPKLFGEVKTRKGGTTQTYKGQILMGWKFVRVENFYGTIKKIPLSDCDSINIQSVSVAIEEPEDIRGYPEREWLTGFVKTTRWRKARSPLL